MLRVDVHFEIREKKVHGKLTIFNQISVGYYIINQQQRERLVDSQLWEISCQQPSHSILEWVHRHWQEIPWGTWGYLLWPS